MRPRRYPKSLSPMSERARSPLTLPASAVRADLRWARLATFAFARSPTNWFEDLYRRSVTHAHLNDLTGERFVRCVKFKQALPCAAPKGRPRQTCGACTVASVDAVLKVSAVARRNRAGQHGARLCGGPPQSQQLPSVAPLAGAMVPRPIPHYAHPTAFGRRVSRPCRSTHSPAIVTAPRCDTVTTHGREYETFNVSKTTVRFDSSNPTRDVTSALLDYLQRTDRRQLCATDKKEIELYHGVLVLQTLWKFETRSRGGVNGCEKDSRGEYESWRNCPTVDRTPRPTRVTFSGD
ncbi:unnamed protein product, partial [Iphiclides podalirius]